MRIPWPGVAAGVFVVALGAAGLVRATVPISSGAAAPTASGQLAVTGAYVRAPVATSQTAAAYFTVRNDTFSADHLDSVTTGAGLQAELHVVGKGGAMSAMSTSSGATIPAHGELVLTLGQSHVMIEQLVAPLKAGDDVNINLDFRTAGTIDVVAPVIALGAPAPTGAPAQPSAAPSSGARS